MLLDIIHDCDFVDYVSNKSGREGAAIAVSSSYCEYQKYESLQQCSGTWPDPRTDCQVVGGSTVAGEVIIAEMASEAQ